MSIDPTWSVDSVTLTMGGPRWTPGTSVGEYALIDCDRRDVYTSHRWIDRSPQPIVHFPPIGGQFTGLARHQLIELTGEARGGSLTISPGGFILGSDWPQEMLISMTGEEREAADVTISFGGLLTLSSNLPQEMSISAGNLVAWPSEERERVGFWHHQSRYLTPQTSVAERIDELILEELGHEDLLLDRKRQAEWLKQVMASNWGINSPQPFIGFDLDDGLFIASWQSDSECNTLTIDAKEHKGWYDPWPASESDNPVPGEIDLETEEAWDRLRTALTTTRP